MEKFTKHYRHLLIALGLLLSIPMAASAQNAPTPNNPSYSTQTKFGYGRFTQNLEVDGLLQMTVGTGGSILGGTAYASLEVPALGQNTTVNFPDPGSTTANVLLDQGVTSAITIQHVSVPLTSANILAMYATPVQLIAAGAAGTNIIVHKIMLTMVTTSTQYTGGTNVEFQLGNTVHGAGTLTTAAIVAAVINAAAGTSYTTVIPVSYTSSAATGLFISNTGSAFTTGTGTGTVDIWYSIK